MHTSKLQKVIEKKLKRNVKNTNKTDICVGLLIKRKN